MGCQIRCERCGDGRFEYTGTVGDTAVRLTCLRCGTTREQEVARSRTAAPA